MEEVGRAPLYGWGGGLVTAPGVEDTYDLKGEDPEEE